MKALQLPCPFSALRLRLLLLEETNTHGGEVAQITQATEGVTVGTVPTEGIKHILQETMQMLPGDSVAAI